MQQQTFVSAKVDDKQLKKMLTQDKHKWKTICEKWEYALKRIKE